MPDSNFVTYNPQIPRSKPIFTIFFLIVISIMFFIEVLSGALTSETKIIQLGAKWNEGISNKEYWRFITSSFLHGNLIHLFLNQTALYVFGKEAESIYGPFRFLFIFLFSSWCATLSSYIFSLNISIGASGAVFGLIGSLAGFYFLQKKKLSGAELKFKTMYTLVIINLIFGLVYPRVDNYAHIGGLLAGIFISTILCPSYILEKDESNGILSVKRKNKLLLETALSLFSIFILYIVTNYFIRVKVS